MKECALWASSCVALLFIKHTIGFDIIGKKICKPRKKYVLPDSLFLCSKVSSFGFLYATRLGKKAKNLK